MTTDACRTFLLSDAPSETDEFGSHQRVANAICELILSEPEGGKTIGIEGTWGSGKSTIVNLIKGNLSSSSENLVFLFDAWAHHDDPLRRTFLESLILQAEEKKWSNDPEVWKRVRHVLAQRVKIESKTTRPKLKPWARLLVLSLLFLPVGTALLSSGLSNPISSVDYFALKLVGGLLCTLLPGLILIGNLAQSWFRGSGISSNAFDEPLAFLLQSFTPDTTTETFQTINPTSIEFENVFSDLMSEILSQGERRVVIVLDNLDRVEANEALSLLSTLQTFLQHSGSNVKWLKRLWIIIPYDREGLEKLWQSNRDTNTQDRSSDDQGKGTDLEIATSFLDKRFQIRFEVPPLVLTNWSEYLNRLFKIAFPDHSETEFHLTYRVYATYRPNANLSPTPRELKQYVNQIGVIHRQWKDSFPLPHIGFYVLLRRARRNVIQELLTDKFREPHLLAVLGSELVDNLTALAFNVEVPLARQLLLREPIEKALGEGNDAGLLELVDLPGFQQVLENIPFGEWDAVRLVNAAHSLDTTGVFEKLSPTTKTTVARGLRIGVLTDSGVVLYEKQARGLLSLFKLTNADTTLVTRVSSSLHSPQIDDSNGRQIQNVRDNPDIFYWVEALIYYINELSQRNILDPKLLMKGPESNDGYILACSYLYEKDPAGFVWQRIKPLGATENRFENFYENMIDGHYLTVGEVNAIKVLAKQEITTNWSKSIDKVKAKLKSMTGLQEDAIAAFFAFLWEAGGVSSNKSVFTDLARDGIILHYLNESKKHEDSIVWCLISQLYSQPNLQQIGQNGNSEQGKAVVNKIFKSPDGYKSITKKFVDIAIQRGLYDLPFRILDANAEAQPWIRSLLALLAEHENEESLLFFAAEVIFKRWKLLRDSLGDEGIDKLFSRPLIQSELIIATTKETFNPSFADLYACMVKAGTHGHPDFIDWSINGIKNMSVEQLQSEIDSDGGVAELLVDLAERNIAFDLGTNYQDILFNHAEKVMAGQIEVTYLKEYWAKLFTFLQPHGRGTLRNRLFDALLDVDGKVSEQFFDLYGDEIVQAERMEKSAKRRELILHLLTPLVKLRNPRGLQWTKSLIEKRPEFANELKKPTADEAKDFLDRLKDEGRKDLSDDASIHIAGIIEMLAGRKEDRIKSEKEITQ